MGGLAGFARLRVGGLFFRSSGIFWRDFGIKTTIGIDKNDFGGMLHELSHSLKGTPYTIRDVVRGEASSVLAATSQRTKPANVGKINRRYTAVDKPHGMVGSFSQPPELVSSVMIHGRRYFTRMRHSNLNWWLIKLRLNEMRLTALSRRMADKGAWYAMAKQAHLLKTPFKDRVQMFNALNNQWPSFFPAMYGMILNNNIDTYAVEVHSHQESVLNPYANGINALERSMRGRVAYYKQNLRRGVFLHAAKIAQRYPHIRVTP
jgi:hypothetical protein